MGIERWESRDRNRETRIERCESKDANRRYEGGRSCGARQLRQPSSNRLWPFSKAPIHRLDVTFENDLLASDGLLDPLRVVDAKRAEPGSGQLSQHLSPMPSTTLVIPSFRRARLQSEVRLEVESAPLRFRLPKLKVDATKHDRLAHPTIAEHRVHLPAQSIERYARDAFGIRLPFFGRGRQMEAPVYRTVKTFVQHVHVHDPVPIPRPGRADDDLTHMFALNDYLRRSNSRSAEKSVHPFEAAPVPTLRGSIMTVRFDGTTGIGSNSEGSTERL
ncbi:MAG: hypothetical protein JWQ11_4544 [Rhizobacter sp.]|nr:hypothetical protein [Rhizobacter sp.]